MIKITDIIEGINGNLKTHYFKDITTFGICKVIRREDSEGDEVFIPAKFEGDGNYSSVIDDNSGLLIWAIIKDFENDEDEDEGFGRNSLTTETYEVRFVFFGQSIAINQDCEDIDLYLAKEFKKLIPRRQNLADTNRLKVTGIKYDKEDLESEEYTPFNADTVLFAIDTEIIIKGIEQCNDLKCN